MAEAATLTIENVAQRLTDFGAMPADACAQVRELGWGISNSVFEVTWPDGCAVVKQALPKLRVAADWPFDMRRSLVERDCLILLGRLVPGSVPAVLGCDESAHTLAISCVPKGGVLWKQALLAGEIEPAVAERAGELLGRIHSLAAPDEQAQARFQDQSVLIQGRTDPFHIAAAGAHPQLAGAIEAEVARMLATRVTLTLGDYSPKNIFCYPDRVVAIDFETAHWGDPAFDVAFCLSHLCLKAFHLSGSAEALLACAARFFAAYDAVGHPGCEQRAVACELGCLMLARIDGKSPVEYIAEEPTRDRVRAAAGELILSPPSTVTQALGVLREHLAQAGAAGAGGTR